VNRSISICWDERCITYGLSVTCVVSLEKGAAGGKIDGGYWERMSQVTKIGKMLLNAGFPFSCLSLHQSNSGLENISVFIYPSPIQWEIQNLFLGRTTIGGALPPYPPTHPNYASDIWGR